jgi:hypothetical protein
MNNEELNRRTFLKKVTVIGSVVAGAGVFVGCGAKEQSASSAKADCSDLSGLTDQDKSIRTTLQYVEVSQVEGKDCENCSFFSQEAGSPCGACTLFKGPIAPKGYCVSWAAKPA